VGGDSEHTVDWLTKFIRDPKSVKPEARMPPFDDHKINDAELRAVAEYLNSLK
jgi:cytochrome c1